jgi:phosphate transport system substrate-binding protein
MIRSLKVWKIWISVLALVPLLAVACGGGEEEPTAAPPKTMEKLTGTVEIDGSSTVYPITEAVAEEFGKAHPEVRVNVGVSGTGGGFKKFCAGETIISDASRPIKQSEVDLCAEAGIEYIELPVAIDGLSIMVNPENDFVECMTIDELNTIWKPEAEEGEAEEVTKWSQVRDGWPDEDIRLYGPGTDSGTFDYFTEVVSGEGGASRGDFLPSEDDNVLVTGIAGDRGSLGYFGYAYYAENADRLKLVGVDGGAGCVFPAEETINNGSYSPLSRPLFIYVSSDALNQPHVKAFVEFYLDQGNQQLVSETGYIPFPETIYDLTLAKFQNGTSGAAFGGDARLSGTVEEVLQASQ